MMNYRNAQYTVDGRIDCEIEHPEFGWIPFTADANDVEDHSRELHKQILKAGNIAAYVPPPGPTLDELEAAARSKRNALLASSDWTQVPDAPVDQAAWATYRQALRDLPQNTTDPREVVWPTPPQ